MKQRRRELNIFSMSFLDAITAGFGAVVLLFMLVNQNALIDTQTAIKATEAEAQRWELKVLTGQKNLVQLKEQLQKQLEQWTAIKAESKLGQLCLHRYRRSERRHRWPGLAALEKGVRKPNTATTATTETTFCFS